MSEDLVQIKKMAYEAAKEMISSGHLEAGDLLVVGCSTSEVGGGKIGTFSSPQLGKEIFEGIYQAAKEQGVYLAAQCCEHLNRALILEKEAAKRYGYEPVSVVPYPKAGGSFATAAYAGFQSPAAVEHVKAHAGLDIGNTLIGMHLKEVAVPVRLAVSKIGEAHLTGALTRPKYIGGERAMYQ